MDQPAYDGDDSDIELPPPDWVQRMANVLRSSVLNGETNVKQARHAIAFLGMLEIEEFLCPRVRFNSVTGRITFFWPATKGGISISMRENLGRCVISYENDHSAQSGKLCGPSLIRKELIKLYPFLKWRWEGNTIV